MNPNISYIKRELEATITSHLNQGKVIILYGARQVGKTTLIKNLFSSAENTYYLACDQVRIREQIIPDSLVLKKIVGNYKTIVFDEAQYLDQAGLVLKILIDNFPQKNIIASGSSAFDLSRKISEPLTGRHYKFFLYPFSITEIASQVEPADLRFYIEQALLFGTYPEIIKKTADEERIRNLQTLTDAYLYKDILEFNLVKNSQKVRELLVALALQIGNEVSYTELANMVGIDRKTVEYYIDLLEKSFVIFRLYGFSRNLRSEINRKVKVYFYDVGVRNALINNFNSLDLRNDGGGIFENFVVSEMLKKEVNKVQRTNMYFWRTYQQKEIDLITEKNGVINAYEIKLKKMKKFQNLKAFQKFYPESRTKIITLDTLFEIF